MTTVFNDYGADYSFYVKDIVSYAPTFLGYNNSVLAIVNDTILVPGQMPQRKSRMPLLGTSY